MPGSAFDEEFDEEEQAPMNSAMATTAPSTAARLRDVLIGFPSEFGRIGQFGTTVTEPDMPAVWVPWMEQ